MDQELRDALRRFISASHREEEIESIMKDPGEHVDANNDANRLHAGEKTREEVVDFLISIFRSLEQWFKDYHAEHGTYPDLCRMHAQPVGVGIMIAHNPLHGSGQAGFPHPVLALGEDAYASQG